MQPQVTAEAVRFAVPDQGYFDVRLHQAVERPRDGPLFTLENGLWELEFRRPQVDRLEYSIAIDGHGTGHTALEFPGYRAPGWLSAPDPAPPRRIDDTTAVWAPEDTDPRRPLPLLVAHDGSEYVNTGQLTRFVAHAIAAGRIPPCRVALLDSPNRNEDYSASARYARALAERLPLLAPATTVAGIGASLGALALLHARQRHPGAFTALYLQSGSFFRHRWDGQESGFPRFDRIARFVGTVLRAGPAATPLPITMNCGAPEENLANNRAVASALRRQGHDLAFQIFRDAHNFVAWRDTFDPQLTELLARAWG